MRGSESGGAADSEKDRKGTRNQNERKRTNETQMDADDTNDDTHLTHALSQTNDLHKIVSGAPAKAVKAPRNKARKRSG